VAPPSALANVAKGKEGVHAVAVQLPLDVYEASLTRPEEKQGELFIALDKAAWEAAYRPPLPTSRPPQPR
jgi:hypothetical protein